MGGPVKDDLHPQAKSQMLPPDTITTMLNCLQQCARYEKVSKFWVVKPNT